MKNTFRALGIIAMISIIGLSMITCDSSGNNEGHGGTFTVTDIAHHNGRYIYFAAERQDRVVIRGVITQINNGKAVIPLLDENDQPYTGNDTFITSNQGGQKIYVYIFDSYPSDNVYYYPRISSASFVSITFLNGNATLSWNDNDLFY